MTRIYKVTTEEGGNGSHWSTYRIAAPNATEAIAKAKKMFSKNLSEELLGVELLASAD